MPIGGAHINRRQWKRVRCGTPACWNTGSLEKSGSWKINNYCTYIAVICPACQAKYWMVNRNGKYSLQDRKEGDSFDSRKIPR